jgi:hypothetical protein
MAAMPCKTSPKLKMSAVGTLSAYSTAMSARSRLSPTVAQGAAKALKGDRKLQTAKPAFRMLMNIYRKIKPVFGTKI